MVSQVVIVLKYKGTPISEDNIKSLVEPKWAWRIAKLAEAVRFETGDWQTEAVQAAIEEHNAKVKALWLAGGNNPLDNCWWHITQITLDHLRPSPKWKRQLEGFN